MPTAPRPARSLLALALVAGVLSASAPPATFGGGGSGSASSPEPRPAADRFVAADRFDAGADAATPARQAEVDLQRARVRSSVARQGQVPDSPTADIGPGRVGWIVRSRPDIPEPKPGSVSKMAADRGGSAATGTFKGRNHVWIPALGIDRSISFYSCSSSTYPGDRVYRWGCAGSNNVYLFGHAHSVFKPLHDAYVRGRLAKGMKVYYANGDGHVSTYAVSWWKVTKPDKGAWAFAAQAKPSLTLQTCVGARSQYRLIVRLAKAG